MASKDERRIFLLIFVVLFIVVNIQGARTTKNAQKSYAYLIRIKTLERTITKYAYDNVVYPNATLNLTTIGRKQMISAHLCLRKPVYKFYIEGFFYQMKDQIFHEVISFPKIEICELIKVSSETFLFREILELLKRVLPKLIHECPYEGVRTLVLFVEFRNLFDFKVVEAYNLSVLPYTNIFMMVPSGLLNIKIKNGFIFHFCQLILRRV